MACTVSSNDRRLNLNVAVHRLGVRADQVCGLDQGLGLVALDPRHADAEAGAQEIGAVGQVQVDLGIDGQVRREFDLALGRGELDRALVNVSGSAGGEV